MGFFGGGTIGSVPRGGMASGGVGGPEQRTPGMQSFKKGGKVKKTGLVHAEKGERVLTKKQQHSKGMK